MTASSKTLAQVAAVAASTSESAAASKAPAYSPKEVEVVKAIGGSVFANVAGTKAEVPSFVVALEVPATVEAKSLPGLIASLNKKGLVLTEKVKGLTMVSLTKAGKEVAGQSVTVKAKKSASLFPEATIECLTS